MPKMHKANEGDYDTAATEPRCVGDVVLRRHGFRIKARPQDGPTLWERCYNHGLWVEYTEQQAHREVAAEEQLVAEAGG